MTNHHPEYEQLVDYTTGSLHPSVTLAVSVHLEYCAECRREVRRLEALGGALLETLEPEPVSDALLDRIFGRIDTAEAITAAHVELPLPDSAIPGSVRKMFDYEIDRLAWRHHGPRVQSATLLGHEGVKASLVRIAAGAKIPVHDHRGLEYTVVLEGSFSDESGLYRQGDFVIRKPGESHAPTATSDHDCLCLTVLEAPLRFRNPFYEAANRLMPL